MKNLISRIAPLLAFILAFYFIFSLLNYSPEVKAVPLNELVQKINQEEIERILITGNKIEINSKSGEKIESLKGEGENLIELMLNLGVEKEKIQKISIEYKEGSGFPLWLGTVLIGFGPIILMLIFFWMLFRQAKTGAMQTFDFTKAKARIFGAGVKPKEQVTFRDVAGLKEVKEELKEIVDFLKNPKKYLKMGAKIPRGVLLVGLPGTGKTLLARAVASEAGVPFFSISGSEFTELFIGVGPARVRDLFNTAKKAGKSIIFIDELDAIGRVRGIGIGGAHDEREQTLNQILVEMDGFERDDTRIVIAATNRPDVLDTALLRPGRFDRRVILDLPDINDREEVLKIHCQGKPLSSDVELREVAERTPGFSGADLANLVNEAAILAARKNKIQIFQEELLASIEKVLLGPERKSHVLSSKEKEMAAFHEAGHALVSTSIPEAEPIRKVSIVARGLVAGYTLKTPKEERNIKTKSEFLAEIATLLGGYCAERLKFKEITTGAANDLQRASELSRKLVKEYGMSSLGPVVFGEREGLFFLGVENEQRNYSEKIAAQIDKEVAKFIKMSEKRAESILKRRKGTLERIARTLIKKETIEKKEFEKIVGKR